MTSGGERDRAAERRAPDTGHHTACKLSPGGKEEGWNIKLMMQLAQSPDLNMNDLEFFASLNSRVDTGLTKSVDVRVSFAEYDSETLENVCQSLLKYRRHTINLGVRGGNEFEGEHAETAKR